MRETARWQDKVDLQLDNRQLYFLFFGTAVAACLVFTVGVLVGKRLESGARPAAATGDPLAALDHIDAVGLGRAAARAESAPPARGAAEAAAPARAAARADGLARGGAGRTSAGHDEGGLTFHRALADAKGKPAAEPLMDRGRAGKAVGAAAAARDRKAPGNRAGAAEVEDGDERAREPERYIVQLKSVPSQSEAEALVRKLSASGYRPYLVSSSSAGRGVTYRVRLGEFASKRAAETAKADFESRERAVAYVSRVK